MKRNATASWQGNGATGTGHLTTQSKVLDAQPYSFRTRFEDESGRSGTNPEELIAAAHAGCFTMALSFQLANAGFTADSLDTEATLRMAKEEQGWRIASIHLELEARIPGIEANQFMELAAAAKENCPVSKVLNADITLESKLH